MHFLFLFNANQIPKEEMLYIRIQPYVNIQVSYRSNYSRPISHKEYAWQRKNALIGSRKGQDSVQWALLCPPWKAKYSLDFKCCMFVLVHILLAYISRMSIHQSSKLILSYKYIHMSIICPFSNGIHRWVIPNYQASFLRYKLSQGTILKTKTSLSKLSMHMSRYENKSFSLICLLNIWNRNKNAENSN